MCPSLTLIWLRLSDTERNGVELSNLEIDRIER